MQIANWARNIAKAEDAATSEIDECFTSGMLHDIGKLALSSNLPDEYRSALELAGRDNLTLFAAEEKVFGANHADVGGYLLSLGDCRRESSTRSRSITTPKAASSKGSAHCPQCMQQMRLRTSCKNGIYGARVQLDADFFEERGFADKLETWKLLKP